MSVEVEFYKIDVLSSEYDFNWAHLTVAWPAEQGSECLAFVEVRVPKTLDSLDEIKKHALIRIKELFQAVSAANYSD